jgi:hypothetical protein
MKNVILSVLVLASTNLFGADGAVGGGGSSSLQLEAAQELMTVYQGANTN